MWLSPTLLEEMYLTPTRLSATSVEVSMLVL